MKPNPALLRTCWPVGLDAGSLRMEGFQFVPGSRTNIATLLETQIREDQKHATKTEVNEASPVEAAQPPVLTRM